MAIVLPVAVDSRLVGSAVFIEAHLNWLLFATSLHLFGSGTDIRIAVPPHEGNCRAVQTYPVLQAPALASRVVASDPFADLVILAAPAAPTANLLVPKIATSAGLLPVGEEVVVLGYPFAPIGSMLETWTPGWVTALARRHIVAPVGVDEIVISLQAHIGSSGSAVVGRRDGILYGIVRGALAPPESLRIGDIPLGTDTSVTFATSAHLLHDMLASARGALDRGNV